MLRKRGHCRADVITAKAFFALLDVQRLGTATGVKRVAPTERCTNSLTERPAPKANDPIGNMGQVIDFLHFHQARLTTAEAKLADAQVELSALRERLDGTETQLVGAIDREEKLKDELTKEREKLQSAEQAAAKFRGEALSLRRKQKKKQQSNKKK